MPRIAVGTMVCLHEHVAASAIMHYTPSSHARSAICMSTGKTITVGLKHNRSWYKHTRMLEDAASHSLCTISVMQHPQACVCACTMICCVSTCCFAVQLGVMPLYSEQWAQGEDNMWSVSQLDTPSANMPIVTIASNSLKDCQAHDSKVNNFLEY